MKKTIIIIVLLSFAFTSLVLYYLSNKAVLSPKTQKSTVQVKKTMKTNGEYTKVAFIKKIDVNKKIIYTRNSTFPFANKKIVGKTKNNNYSLLFFSKENIVIKVENLKAGKLINKSFNLREMKIFLDFSKNDKIRILSKKDITLPRLEVLSYLKKEISNKKVKDIDNWSIYNIGKKQVIIKDIVSGEVGALYFKLPNNHFYIETLTIKPYFN